MIPNSEEQKINDFVVQLEREADRLRRNRRLYRRILGAYLVLGGGFLAVRTVQVVQEIRPKVTFSSEYTDRGGKRPTSSVQTSQLRDRIDVTLPNVIDWHWDKFTTYFPWEASCAVIGLGVCVLLGIRRAAGAQKRAGRSLSTFEDVRATGPLIEVLMVEDAQVRDLARKSLRSVLPRLRASDAGLLNDQHHRLLHKELKTTDVAWALCILKAFEQVGDGRDIPVVEKLVRGETTQRISKEVSVAAEECLLFLSQRDEERRMRSTLLRASAIEENGSSLLRPSVNADAVDPQQLLRATEV